MRPAEYVLNALYWAGMAQMKLLVDLPGALVRTPRDARDRALLQAAGIYDVASEQAQKFWQVFAGLRPAYFSGDLVDQRFWQQMIARVGLDDCDIAEAIAADTNPSNHLDTEVWGCIDSLLDAGMSVGGTANCSLSEAQNLRSQHPQFAELDALVLSCDIGVALPDERMLEVAADAIGGSVRETMFISTNEGHLAAAAELGMCARLYLGVGQLCELVDQVSR